MDFLKLLRVKQWIKNSFVLVPLFFSLEFLNINSIYNAILAFLSFCFASSFIYIINDIMDRKEDALHNKKKHRPIANGKISVSSAIIYCILCLLFSALFVYILDYQRVTLCISLYILVNLAYSKWLKHISLIDVFCIAFGFILRAYVGAYAINVPVSSFLFMITLFLSLFLALSKRKAELIKQGSLSRKSLNGYTLATLEKLQTLLAGSVIMSYALYTLDHNTLVQFGNKLIYSVIFVVFGIFRYMEQSDKFSDYEDPTENLYKDKYLITIVFVYIAYLTTIIIINKLI